MFLAGSVLGAASWNTESLITARVLQGAAAGVLQPLAMIALFEVFPIEERGRAMGLFGFGIVLAPAIGPAIGGCADARVRLALDLPAARCPSASPAFALGWRCLPAVGPRRPRRRFDWIGSVLLALALVALLNVPVIGHRVGWGSLGSARASRRGAADSVSRS